MNEGPEREGVRQAPFQHLSRRRVGTVLNCLTESTFFYRDDDADHFDYLRRNRAAFQSFFEEWFDWDLHVDRKCARLFKRRQHNPALTRKQRHLFDLTRRDECILFMLLLQFHEMQLAHHNAHYEHDDDLLFELGEFVQHALQSYRAHAGERAPGDRELFSSIQSLFRELERHRFVREVERGRPEDGVSLPAGQTERVLYAFLPGLHCYDPARMSREVFARSFGGPEATGDEESDIGRADGGTHDELEPSPSQPEPSDAALAAPGRPDPAGTPLSDGIEANMPEADHDPSAKKHGA